MVKRGEHHHRAREWTGKKLHLVGNVSLLMEFDATGVADAGMPASTPGASGSSAYAFRRPGSCWCSRRSRTTASATTTNELRFVGDAVLDCVVGAVLYDRFPGLPEGSTSRMRRARQPPAHAGRARQCRPRCRILLVGEGERRAAAQDRPSILADALETVFGAVFVDAATRPRAGDPRVYGGMLPTRTRRCSARMRDAAGGMAAGAQTPVPEYVTHCGARPARRSRSPVPHSVARRRDHRHGSAAVPTSAPPKSAPPAVGRTVGDVAAPPMNFRCGHVAIVGPPERRQSRRSTGSSARRWHHLAQGADDARHPGRRHPDHAERAQFVFVDTPGLNKAPLEAQRAAQPRRCGRASPTSTRSCWCWTPRLTRTDATW